MLFNPEHVGVHASDLGSAPSAATSTAPARSQARGKRRHPSKPRNPRPPMPPLEDDEDLTPPMTELERLNSIREKLIEVFKVFDTDETNTVSHEEFDVAIQLLGFNIRETPFAEIVEKTKDDSNRVNYIAYLDNVRELV